MQKLVFTNGGGQSIDLTSGNFGITNWEGLSGVGLNIQTQQVPFQDGGVFLDALMEQREISVTVAIQDNNDLSARYERKRQLISALNPKLGEGVLVYTNDYLSRQIKAVPQLPIFENKNSNDAGTLKASVVFSCPSPYWEDLEDTIVVFNSEEQPTVINKGDIPAQVEMEWITKNVTNGEVINNANNKKIKYVGLLQNGLKINTNIGKKSVVEQSLNMIITNSANYKRFKFVNYKLFCLGEQSSILTSADGKEWQALECPFENIEFRDMCYNESAQTYFFAGTKNISESVSQGVVVKLDSQGNWNQYSQGNGYTESIIYASNLGLYLAGGTSLQTSPDGITWTSRSLSSVQCMIYKKNIIIATTYGGIYTSTDGINWTKRDNAFSKSIVYSRYNNLFVITSTNEFKKIKTSTDGITWNTINFTDLNYETAGSVFYVDELKKYICFAYNQNGWTSSLYVSFDANTWVKKYNFEEGKSIGYNVCFDENLGLMFGSFNNGYATSSDGEKWEYNIKSVAPYTYRYPQGTFLKDITQGEGKYIAIMTNDATEGKVVKSEDGVNWRLNSGEDVYTLRYASKIIYSERLKLFIIGSDTTTVITSSNGEDWTTHNITSCLFDILETENELCGCGFNFTNSTFATSSDGITWNSVNITNESEDKVLNGIAWSKSLGLYVVVGNGGKIFTSSNKTTWTSRISGTNENLNSVLYSEIAELFIAVGENGTILTSPDGITWTARGTETKNLNRVVYLKLYGSIIIVGDNGIILSSIDGINWSNVQSNISVNLYGITMGNNLIAVGGVNTIITSMPKEIQNAISKLSSDSDINFNLELGRNRLRIGKTAGDMNVRISFRQKYIGV